MATVNGCNCSVEDLVPVAFAGAVEAPSLAACGLAMDAVLFLGAAVSVLAELLVSTYSPFSFASADKDDAPFNDALSLPALAYLVSIIAVLFASSLTIGSCVTYVL